MLHLCCSQWDRRREQLSAGRLHSCQSTGKCPPGASLNFNGSREENSANKASHGIQHTLILPDVCQRTTSLRKIASSVTSLPGFLLFLRTCFEVTYQTQRESVKVCLFMVSITDIQPDKRTML